MRVGSVDRCQRNKSLHKPFFWSLKDEASLVGAGLGATLESSISGYSRGLQEREQVGCRSL